jgi:hypothetical protein
MGGIVGPTPWWQSNLAAACPEGSNLPDGSIIICKSGGTAWIVAPGCTQVNGPPWGNYATEGNTVQGDLPQITPTIWPALYNRLVSCGFNPNDWFVPSISQLQNPGRVCCNKWYTSSKCFWSSTEVNSAVARSLRLDAGAQDTCKCRQDAGAFSVRAFRCVTY